MEKLKFARRGLITAMVLQVINIVYVVMAPHVPLVGVAILIIVGVLTLIVLWVTTNAVAQAFEEAFGNKDDDNSEDDESGEDDEGSDEGGEDDSDSTGGETET